MIESKKTFVFINAIGAIISALSIFILYINIFHILDDYIKLIISVISLPFFLNLWIYMKSAGVIGGKGERAKRKHYLAIISATYIAVAGVLKTFNEYNQNMRDFDRSSLTEFVFDTGAFFFVFGVISFYGFVFGIWLAKKLFL